MSLYMQGKEPICFGNTCVMGSQAYYITHCDPKHFQPMNANFGIVYKANKDPKEQVISRSLEEIEKFKAEVYDLIDATENLDNTDIIKALVSIAYYSLGQ